MCAYEPSPLEVRITRLAGRIISLFYRDYALSLGLTGSEKVLDYGSGSGNLSRHLAEILKNGGRLTCADVSEEWQKVIRQELRRFNNVDYYLGDIRNLNLADGSFQAVVMHFVMHEIPARERAEQAACLVKKLAPGGRMLVREPNNTQESLPVAEIEGLFKKLGLQTLICKEVRSRLAGPMSVYMGQKS